MTSHSLLFSPHTSKHHSFFQIYQIQPVPHATGGYLHIGYIYLLFYTHHLASFKYTNWNQLHWFNPERREQWVFSSFSKCRIGFPLRFQLFSVPQALIVNDWANVCVCGALPWICVPWLTNKSIKCALLWRGFYKHFNNN